MEPLKNLLSYYIHKSHDIPGAPLVYVSNLDSTLKKNLKELVLNAHNHIKVGGYGGLMERMILMKVTRNT